MSGGVVDGTPVDAANTNPKFIFKDADDTSSGVLQLDNTNTVSGSTVSNLQREHNSIASYTGKTLNSVKNDTPTYTNNQGFTSSENLTSRVDGVSGKFNGTLGHRHTGNPGDGATVDANTISNTPLNGYIIQGTNITGATGSSTDVSSLLSTETASTNTAQQGVVTNTPWNKVTIRNSTGSEILDGSGNLVYGRITFATSVWTLSYYSLVSNVETVYSFGSPTNIEWYYQKLFNPLNNPPVYNSAFFFPSDNATQDILDASATVRGLVNTTTQTFAGNKTFTGTIGASNFSGSSSGTNTGDQTITLTGDVTGSGTGSFAATISANAVTNTKLAQMTAHTVKGNNSGVTANASDLALSNVTETGSSVLTITNGTNAIVGASNLTIQVSQSTTSTSGYLSSTDWNTFNGKQAAGNYITALTGDVTASGPGSVSSTIASNAVTNAKLAQMAAHTFKGNNTGSTANASDLTATQLTAELNQFTSTLQGVVPGSGGGTSNFLRADGSWTTPTAAASPLNITSQTTTYTASTNDYIIASSASFTITLPTAVGNSGKDIYIKHNGTSLSQVYTLNTTSSQTIGGIASGSYALYTNGEVLRVTSDGSNWLITDHRTNTAWASYTPTTQGFGTITNSLSMWRRVGDSIEIKSKFIAGTTTAVQAQFGFPSGATASSVITVLLKVGDGSRSISSTQTANGVNVQCNGGNSFFNFGDRNLSDSNAMVAENGSGVLGNGEALWFYGSVPIQGWQP